jgi:hypothetical protein
MDNISRIKNIKKKAEILSQEYHENMEKLKFYDKDIDFMIKKTQNQEAKLDKLLSHYK